MFLLCLDEITLLRRLADPQRGNDFGAVGGTGEQARLWRADFQRRMLTPGATPIDASMPVARVVDLLLAHTTRADSPSDRQSDTGTYAWLEGSGACNRRSRARNACWRRPARTPVAAASLREGLEETRT